MPVRTRRITDRHQLLPLPLLLSLLILILILIPIHRTIITLTMQTIITNEVGRMRMKIFSSSPTSAAAAVAAATTTATRSTNDPKRTAVIP